MTTPTPGPSPAAPPARLCKTVSFAWPLEPGDILKMTPCPVFTTSRSSVEAARRVKEPACVGVFLGRGFPHHCRGSPALADRSGLLLHDLSQRETGQQMKQWAGFWTIPQAPCFQPLSSENSPPSGPRLLLVVILGVVADSFTSRIQGTTSCLQGLSSSH